MWVASVNFILINQLNGQKSSCKANSDLPFVTYAHQLYSSRPLSCIVQGADGINFIPVWSQLRTNSGGISSNSTMLTKSSRNSFLFSLKFMSTSLLLAVVAFLWTKFIQRNRESAHCLLRSMLPPNYLSFCLSIVFIIPLAAPITI